MVSDCDQAFPHLLIAHRVVGEGLRVKGFGPEQSLGLGFHILGGFLIIVV